MKVVAARVKLGSRVYNSSEFYCKTFFDVEAGQQVVVDIPGHGLSVAMISNVNMPASIHPKNVSIPVVQLIDTSAYEDYISRDKRLAELLEQMDRRVHELKSQDIYEKLAKEDEVLASLLIDYKSLLAKYPERDS